MRECIAKVKFWFGCNEDIFNTDKYDVEYDESKIYAYLYAKAKNTSEVL